MNKVCRSFMVTVLFTCCLLASTEVRNTVPPELGDNCWGEQVLCHRPMRRGAPEMSVEVKKDGVIIAHNYGHGGSGWTLAPGAASYVSGLMIEKGAAKEDQVTVVGAGVIGLFTAYDLIQRGFNNVQILSKAFDDLTSHRAGGLLAPVSMDNVPEMQATIDQIGIDAYKFYADIASGRHADFENGSVIVPTYFESREESGLDPYVGKVMQPAKDVVLDFGNGTQRKMVAYDDGIFIDTAVMMDQLIKYLKAKGVSFKRATISDYSEVDSRVIVDCTGLGAKDLNKDDQMVSVQGHLIMLKNQKNIESLKYMILVYFGSDTTSTGLPIKRSFYYFPKHLLGTKDHEIGVVGGTFIEGGTQDTPHDEEFKRIIQQTREFYGIKDLQS